MSDLVIKNLHVSIDDKEILRGLDLTVEQGKVHAITCTGANLEEEGWGIGRPEDWKTGRPDGTRLFQVLNLAILRCLCLQLEERIAHLLSLLHVQAGYLPGQIPHAAKIRGALGDADGAACVQDVERV